MLQRIKGKNTITVGSRAEWRQWLLENSQSQKEIWLVYYKKHTGKPSLTKAEANKEALCFGWIDSLIQSIDAERYMQKFSPRKAGSIWSELNKRRARDLIDKGLMTSRGNQRIDEAKASGEWHLNRDTPREIEIPSILESMLEKEPMAKDCWRKLIPSQRKQYCLWILLAKQEETKIRRAQKAIKMMTSGKPPSSL
ncbi:MAG: YdeI/OmpD-associated family protein [Candidatus Marinimicrobia bacterium]|nr:YdeI/OmpD-associated family protein [Candidatus Neomarinimicrobiota bacterium]MCF7921641.1 YdeI/OmpD-associated family protein [Candidatus Neomarinimicrobiota bacterium]